jgi:hypothetical protein
MSTRTYASRRHNILEGLVTALKTIDGSGAFLSNLGENVHPRMKFWDEVEEFPAIHLNAGSESREYQTGGYKDRFLQVTVRCYVNEEDAQVALGALLEDVETVLEKHSRLTYFDSRFTKHSTQQGVLEPLGVGEMIIEVRY